MSWWLHVVPLHVLDPETLAFAAAAEDSHGLPDRLPPPQPLPTVSQVLAAWDAAGVHGSAWFTVEPGAGVTGLAECPDPAGCRDQDGLDLGEVTMRGPHREDGGSGDTEALAPGAAVESIGFRKPSERGPLVGVCALTGSAGSLAVLDDAGTCVAVHPGDTPDTLSAVWPW